MKLTSYFIALILSLTSTWAMDINTTIIDANSTVYQKLLDTLSKEDNRTSEINLETSLLTMLIKPQKLGIKDINYTKAEDEKAYKILFLNYLDDTLSLDVLQQKLSKIQNNIETIENQIKDLKQGDNSALSMELQDAFYHKKLKFLKKEILFFQDQMKKIQKLILNSLHNLTIQNINLTQSIEKNIKIQSHN